VALLGILNPKPCKARLDTDEERKLDVESGIPNNFPEHVKVLLSVATSCALALGKF